jgi:hypothetical protein
MLKHIWLSILFITLIATGIMPQYPSTMLKVTIVGDDIELFDIHNRVIEPLMVKRTMISSYSANNNFSEFYIVASTGERTQAITYVNGYLISIEGQMHETPPIVSEIDGVMISISGYETSKTFIYDCQEKQELHSENKPTTIFIRESPIYLPPRRIII